MKYTIYINEAPFTAHVETIDLVTAALRKDGFVYDETTEGWVSEGYYNEAAHTTQTRPLTDKEVSDTVARLSRET